MKTDSIKYKDFPKWVSAHSVRNLPTVAIPVKFPGTNLWQVQRLEIIERKKERSFIKFWVKHEFCLLAWVTIDNQVFNTEQKAESFIKQIIATRVDTFEKKTGQVYYGRALELVEIKKVKA